MIAVGVLENSGDHVRHPGYHLRGDVFDLDESERILVKIKTKIKKKKHSTHFKLSSFSWCKLSFSVSMILSSSCSVAVLIPPTNCGFDSIMVATNKTEIKINFIAALLLNFDVENDKK